MDEYTPNREPSELLCKLGSAINDIHQCKTVKDMLCCIRSIVRECFGFNVVWLYVFDEDNTDKVKLITVSGHQEDFIKQELSLIESENDEMLKQIFSTHRPVYVENSLTDPRTNKEVVKRCGSKTLLNCQLLVDGKSIGTLGTGTMFDEGFVKLDQDDLSFFEAISKATSIAFDCIKKTSESNKDALTNLYNRRGLYSNAEQLLALSERNKQRLGVIYLDLTNFKPINDKFGHDVGDAALVAFSKLLSNSIRKSDVVARTGGDEFVIIVRDIKQSKNLDALVTTIKTQSCLSLGEGVEFEIGFSSGFAIYPDDATELDHLIRIADNRMYNHKQNSRGLNRNPVV